MPHPYRDRKRLFWIDRNDAIGDPDCLSAIELEDLVAVMAVVGGEANGPVQGAAWGREQLGSARHSTWGIHTMTLSELYVKDLKDTVSQNDADVLSFSYGYTRGYFQMTSSQK